MTTTETSRQNLTRLGKLQREWIEWAIDPMDDFFCSEQGAHDRDGDVLDETALPRLDGATLIWDHCPDEVAGDLVYRITEQAPDMAEEEATYGDDDQRKAARSDMRALELLAKRMESEPVAGCPSCKGVDR